MRAFHLGEVIVVNSNLKSLDAKMRKSVQEGIRHLVEQDYEGFGKKYTVFIK